MGLNLIITDAVRRSVRPGPGTPERDLLAKLVGPPVTSAVLLSIRG